MLREIISSHIVFSPAVSPQREADIAYFASVCPQKRRSLSPREVQLSLKEFSEAMSGDKLTEFMAKYRKQGVPTDSYEFALGRVSDKSGRTVGTDGYGNFYMDSERGIALGIRKPGDAKTIWIGVVGISMGREVDEYSKDIVDSKASVKGRVNFSYQFPVITQLQGPRGDSNYYAANDAADIDAKAKYKTALEALSKYKWERALIDIVLEWAYLQEIPAVYLLPANLQKWRPENNREAYGMRYDVSAQRMGFRMQPNGLYGISLLSFPNTAAA